MSRSKLPARVPPPRTLDARAKKRALELLAIVADRKDAVATAFYDMGLALRELLDKKLYASLGYASFAAMLEDRKVMSASFAFRLVAVTRAFTRAETRELSAKKAMSLVRLAAATAEDDTPKQLARRGVVVDGRRTSVRELSGERIAEQARRVSKNRRAARDDPEREAANDALDVVQKKLRRRKIRVTLRLAEDRGRLRVHAELPYEDIDALLRALS